MINKFLQELKKKLSIKKISLVLFILFFIYLVIFISLKFNLIFSIINFLNTLIKKPILTLLSIFIFLLIIIFEIFSRLYIVLFIWTTIGAFYDTSRIKLKITPLIPIYFSTLFFMDPNYILNMDLKIKFSHFLYFNLLPIKDIVTTPLKIILINIKKLC